ncbi:MAG: phospholipid carrier-dependent glycosyltransferase [Thermoanaerobaculia bacterium]
MIAALLFILQHAAALAILLLVAAGAGTAVSGVRFPLAARAALGLAVLGQLFVVLGVCGALRPWPLLALAMLALVGGAARSTRIRPSGRMAGTAALVTLGTVPLFVLALHPPLAFDETLYHLPIVRALADSGAIRFLPYLRFPIFPELHEALCVPGFLALGDVATHLVSVAELLILAGLLAAWPRLRSRYTGPLAAVLLLGNPIVIQLATITYVESALALFVAAGYFFLERAMPEPGEEPPGARSDAAAAGFLLGSACGVKYLGGYFAAAGLLLLVFHSLRTTRSGRPVLVFGAGLLAALLPTYTLLIWLGGNPVFPFLSGLFGASPWQVGTIGPGFSFFRVLRLPWDLTFAREHVNFQPPYSPLFMLSLGATLVAAPRNRRAAFLSALAVGYFICFAFLPPDSRYLIPLLPLACVAGASAVARWKRLSVALAGVSMAVFAAYAGWRIARLGPPPTHPAARQRVLEREIPELRALSRREPGPVTVCGAEQLQYFGGGEGLLLGDVVGPYASERIVGGARDSADLARRLLALGTPQLLVSRRGCRPEWQRLPEPPAFVLIYADAGAVLWRVASPAP